MSAAKNKKSMKNRVTRHGKLLGGYVPTPIVAAIEIWVARDPERDVSKFIRQASREKLERDGIPFDEKNPQPATV
jgi:hypothetical protein